ncbi:MAG TPA: SRPBCC domain-containing protein [Vicinamibacteria bacterium]|jgi:uncharacterized protein YndB with AHSA1/START domain|nr:SRPBCC domain-containing protein [Vicinamibacteria bacterium]
MGNENSKNAPPLRPLSLEVRRVIRATADTVFEAWTQPAHLREWWGPRDVTCVDAQIDLRVGGRYRIGNQHPDGRIVWIVGEFEVIKPAHELVYTWRLESASQPPERVHVRFEPHANGTEVIVVHQRILDPSVRDRHREGWHGCLEGLAEHLERPFVQ